MRILCSAMTKPNQILQCYLSLYSYSIRGHEHGHFKQITVFQIACTVCVNKLDTNLLTKMSLTVLFEVAENKHHSRVNSYE